MKTRGVALAAASALLTTTLTTVLSAPAAHATTVHEGWCLKDEGLSVVVDYGGIEKPGLPTDGWDVRCIVGGEIQSGKGSSYSRAIATAGFTINADSGGFVEGINGVEMYEDHPDFWWGISATELDAGAWNMGNYSMVEDGPNINVALGARFGMDFPNTPRPAPQYGEPAAPEPTPAVSGSVPTLSGIGRVGQTLKANAGAWTPGTSLTFQWLRRGTAIAGATGAAYTATAADRSALISLRVTGAKAGHTSTGRTSASVAIAAGILTAVRPTITGKAKKGKTLKVKAGAWRPGPVTLRYTWLRNGKTIAKATSARYTLTAKDRGEKISVRVTGTKAGYTTLSLTTKKTAKVKR